MYHIISIEDSPAEEDVIRRHLERYARETGTDYKLTWFKTAGEFLDRERPADLIFMDIDLPGINGMEAATLLRTYDSETPLIFVTNLAQYAIKGYEVDALDFVVKPVGYHDFALRMKKALRVLARNTGRTLTIATREGLHVLAVSDLAYVEVTNHELAYHTDAGEPLCCRGSLRDVEAQLGNAPFTRISNSCLVNMGHIKQVLRDGLRMAGGEALYFSRGRKRPAMEDITAYLGGSR